MKCSPMKHDWLVSRTTKRDALVHWRKLGILKTCAKSATKKLNG